MEEREKGREGREGNGWPLTSLSLFLFSHLSLLSLALDVRKGRYCERKIKGGRRAGKGEVRRKSLERIESWSHPPEREEERESKQGALGY